jgi:putative addiction module killer protein
MEKLFQVEYYVKENGETPLTIWINRLDNMTQARIVIRFSRMEFGNLGVTNSVGDGVQELKYRLGPGYRVYYFQVDQKVILLLCGGDKSTQQKDIEKAKEYKRDYERRNQS